MFSPLCVLYCLQKVLVQHGLPQEKNTGAHGDNDRLLQKKPQQAYRHTFSSLLFLPYTRHSGSESSFV